MVIGIKKSKTAIVVVLICMLFLSYCFADTVLSELEFEVTESSIGINMLANDTQVGLADKPYKVSVYDQDDNVYKSDWLSNTQITRGSVNLGYSKLFDKNDRNIVRLENGDLVAIGKNGRKIVVYKSENFGETWSEVCYLEDPSMEYNSASLVARDNIIVILANRGNKQIISTTVSVAIQANTNINDSVGIVLESSNTLGKVSLTIDAVGTLHAVCEDTIFVNSGSYFNYCKSTNSGYTWSTPVKIKKSGNMHDPVITVGKNGHAIIVYYRVYYDGTKNIYILCSRSSNANWAIENVIHETTGLYSSISVDSLSDGNVIVAYSERVDGEFRNKTNYTQSTNNGVSWSTAESVNLNDKSNSLVSVSITRNSEDEVFILWHGDISENGIYMVQGKSGNWSSPQLIQPLYSTNICTINNFRDYQSPIFVSSNYPAYFSGEWHEPFATKNVNINSLLPNKSYRVEVEVKNATNEIVKDTKFVSTKALKPIIEVQDISSEELILKEQSSNPPDTKYKFYVDGNYVSRYGSTISNESEEWYTINNKTFSIKDLKPGTEYTITVQAINHDGIVTEYSEAVKQFTKGEIIIDKFESTTTNNGVSFSFNAYDDIFGLKELPYNIRIFESELEVVNSGNLSGSEHSYNTTQVVEKPYSTQGNGGRKALVLDNGWIVTSAVKNGERIELYVNKNDGNDFVRLCYIASSTSGDYAISYIGDNSIVLLRETGAQVRAYLIDAVNITDTNQTSYINLLPSQNLIDISNVSLAVNSNKTKICAVASTKSSTYPNSYNLQGWHGEITSGNVNWSDVMQITSINYPGYNYLSPVMVMIESEPMVIYSKEINSSEFGIGYHRYKDGKWIDDGNSIGIYNGNEFIQANPSVSYIPQNIASKKSWGSEEKTINARENGVIIACWEGLDIENNIHKSIRSHVSFDKGLTWFAFGENDNIVATSSTHAYGDVTICWNNKSDIFLSYYQATNGGIIYRKHDTSWIAPKTIDANVALFPSSINNYHNFDEPMLLYQDNTQSSIKFYGKLIDNILDETYSYEELIPNTTYKAILSVKNTLNNVTTKEKYFTTLAEASVINEVSTSSDSLTFKIADNNSYRTGYKVYVNDQYVNMFGEISEQDSEWYRMSIDDASGEKRFTIRGLNPGTENRMKIKSRNHEGIETEFSNELVMSTMNVSPSGLVENIVAESTRDTISLAWGPVKYASSYVVKINDVMTEVNINSISIKSGDIAGLDILPNTAYKISVASKNAVSTTEYSLPVTIKTQLPKPTTPVLEIASTTNNSVSLSWAELLNVNKYELEVDGKLVDMNLDNFYKHNNLVKGSQHTYRIRSYNKDGMSDWSEAIIVKTSHADIVPTLQEGVEKVSEKSVTLSWNPVENAKVYYVQKDDGDVLKSNGNVYAIYNGLSPNTEYNFKVYAGDEVSYNSTVIVNLNVKTQLLSTPTIENVAEAEMYKIKWHPIEEATSYEIMFDDKVETLITVTDTSYSSSIESLRSYSTVKIRAKNDVGYSSYSNILSVMLKEDIPESPSKLEALSGENFIMIKWQDIDPNYYYDLEVDGAVIESIERDKYLHDGLVAFSNHKYRVRSKSDMMEGLWSQFLEIVTLPTKPLPPSNVVIKNTRSTATLSWDKIPSAEGYEVKVNEDKVYKLGSQTTYTHRGIPLNAEQTYRVRTRNIIGESEWSNLIVNNSLRALCQRDSVIDLGLTASNVDDFSKYILRVTYNPDVLEVTDLCGYTSDIELEAGIIESEDIEVVEFDEKLIDGVKTGVITFKVSKPVEEGYSWTGILNNIKFKSKLTGITYLTYTVLIDEANDGGHNE